MNRTRNHIRTSGWKSDATIPLHEIADFLSDEDYELYCNRYENVEIVIDFDYNPADPEVGIPFGYMEFSGDWQPQSKEGYPKAIEDAIEKHLNTVDVNSLYGDQAYDRFCDYCDYMEDSGL